MLPSSISVIVPTYNRADLLPATLDAILAQTLAPLEVLVVDDGSTDDTAAVVARYGERVIYVPLQHTGLPAAARNAGLRRARGEWIAFCDSDDIWLPAKLEEQLAAAAAWPSAGFICSNARVLHGEGGRMGPLVVPVKHPSDLYGVEQLVRWNFVVASSVLVRRSLLEKTGLFAEEPALRAVEDYDLWLRLTLRAPVLYLAQPLLLYRDAPHASIRAHVPTVAHSMAHLRALERLRSDPDVHALGRRLDRNMSRQEAEREFDIAAAHLRAGAVLRSATGLLRMIQHSPLRTLRLTSGTVARQGQRAFRFAGRRLAPHHAVRPATGLRLHLGCGERYLPGYINTDFPPSQHLAARQVRVDLYADIAQLHMPPETVDEVRLHHVFEHFDRVVALQLLMEWYAWLRPSGRLVIETPDFEACARRFLRARSTEEKSVLTRHIFGSHEAAWAVHYNGWYEERFRRVLTALGYGGLRFKRTAWKGTYNITVRATKLSPAMSRTAQMLAAENLLRLDLVDNSPAEAHLFEAWATRLTQEHDRR